MKESRRNGDCSVPLCPGAVFKCAALQRAALKCTALLCAALLCAALLCAALLIFFTATGCRREKKVAQDDSITIGFSIATDTFILERWNKDIKIFTGAARDLGAEVIVQLSAGGTKEQIAQINFMLDKDIDVLVVIAHDSEMLSGVVKKARDAKIPVIAYDRLIMGVQIDAYVSFNNREVGRLFGRALSHAVPEGRYLIVNGSVHDNNSYEVNAGLHEILDPLIAPGKVHIVREIWLDEWSFDEALEKIGEVFSEDVDFDAISCANDQIAEAAIQLLSEYRLAGKVAVVGQDADIGACQKVVEGTQLMTVYKPIAKLANSAAAIAVALARGMQVPTELSADNKSGSMIPFYIQEPQPVYRETMDTTVILDGFHSREDVYRNFPGQVK
ncbi:MAG TPA: substrate-binding domain-containing protein [Treponemataceae bacterium]|nr:substrate-binding domain-containing protein [Treponemataceae bacterium]